MKSQLAEVQTGFEPLFFHIQADFQWQRPFSEGCGVDFRKIEEKSFTKLWALDCWFSRTKSSAFFALKKGAKDWRYDSVFWALPVSTQWHIHSECLSSNTNKKTCSNSTFCREQKRAAFPKNSRKSGSKSLG